MAPTSLQIPANVGEDGQQQHNSSQQQPSSRRYRASHNVLTSTHNDDTNNQTNNQASSSSSAPPQHIYADVYSHPAAVAYAAAHPRRTIPKFGPYLLLQTLGEGEFGKVKLGIHHQWGEEVAVKLIRRGNVDSTVRMTKVEREIEVLKTLKHPNIVRLYDVIETDKYIGIILEYASGGELFDHILAHRYLRERDAAKLFSQLISGVWYIHQKKIVHRDLKLENLLLDRQRNVIITDFGFANRFEHRQDDLMQTSCGSPCYAAPELVISEGLYVGSAVDIWSCGVILYAMLAGYLPFDDDPANPDGDNINLLYKYIVSTPLSFPDYVSMEARDLLGMMLVPDPTRRSTLEGVMRHPWLNAFHHPLSADADEDTPTAFGRTVEELEKAALDQHHQKRVAYQKQMRAAASATSGATSGSSSAAPGPSSAIALTNSGPPLAAPTPSRAQSHRPEAISSHSHHHPHQPIQYSPTRSRSTQPEYLYESSADQSLLTSPAPATPSMHNGKRPVVQASPDVLGLSEDDPFAGPPSGPPSASANAIAVNNGSMLTPTAPIPSKSGHGGFRHTIQLEYEDRQSTTNGSSARRGEDRDKERKRNQQPQNLGKEPQQQQQQGGRRPSQSGGSSGSKPLPPQPSSHPRTPSASAVPSIPTRTSPPRNANASAGFADTQTPAQPSLIVNVTGPTPVHYSTMSASPPNPNSNARFYEKGVSSNNDHNNTTQHQDKTPSQNSSPTRSESKRAASSEKAQAQGGHKKGKSSIDRMGLGKIFGGGFGGGGSSGGNGGGGSSIETSGDAGGESNSSVLMSPSGGSEHSQSRDPTIESTNSRDANKENTKENKGKEGKEGKEKEGKKSRRNTLTVMVEPISRSIRNRKAATSSTDRGKRAANSSTQSGPVSAGAGGALFGLLGSGSSEKVKVREPNTAPVNSINANGDFLSTPELQSSTKPSSGAPLPPVPTFSQEFAMDTSMVDGSQGMQASTSKAKKVMQWFRTRSKGRDSVGFGGPVSAAEDRSQGQEQFEATQTPTKSQKYRRGYSASSSTVNQTSVATNNNNNEKLPDASIMDLKVVVTTPTSSTMRVASSGSASAHPSSAHPSRAESVSASTPSFVTRFRNSVTSVASSHKDREANMSPSSEHKSSKSSGHRTLLNFYSSSSNHGQSQNQSSSQTPAHPFAQLRIHHGAVDQTTITTRPPPEVIERVRNVLDGMGVETRVEGEYKYRCVRAKRKKGAMTMDGPSGPSSSSSSTMMMTLNGGVGQQGQQGQQGLAAITISGSAASNGVDKRGLPLPSPSAAFGATGGMLRGLLMRRQSSQVSNHSQSQGQGQGDVSQPSLAFDDDSSVLVSEPLVMALSSPSEAQQSLNTSSAPTAYGDPAQDAGDEVRFSVELTRLDRLDGTYSLDIRRLKGNLRSYKFLYDTIRDRADLAASAQRLPSSTH